MHGINRHSEGFRNEKFSRKLTAATMTPPDMPRKAVMNRLIHAHAAAAAAPDSIRRAHARESHCRGLTQCLPHLLSFWREARESGKNNTIVARAHSYLAPASTLEKVKVRVVRHLLSRHANVWLFFVGDVCRLCTCEGAVIVLAVERLIHVAIVDTSARLPSSFSGAKRLVWRATLDSGNFFIF